MPKVFEPHTVDEFKGLSYDPNENNYRAEDGVAPDMTNWNITPEKFLEKRPGLYLTKGSQSGLVKTRLFAIQQSNPNTGTDYLIYGDAFKLFRSALPALVGGTELRYPEVPTTSCAGAQWMVEYGIYDMQFISSTATHISGMRGIYADGRVTGFHVNSPAGTHLSVFKDRFFALNSLHSGFVAANPERGSESRLWFSDEARPDLWGGAGLTNNFDISNGDGDYLVCTVPYNDSLIIFKSKSTWILNTENADPRNWPLRVLSDSIGCVGRGSAQIIGGFIYFLAAEGVYKTDGTTFQLISDPIRKYLRRDSWSPTNALEIWSTYWDDKYVLFLPYLGWNNTPLVYDTRAEVWVRWQYAGTNAISIAGVLPYPQVSTDPIYLGSNANTKIFQMSTQLAVYRDDSVAYECLWESATMDFGDPISMKRNHLVALDVGTSSTLVPGQYEVSYRKDSENFSTPQPTRPAHSYTRKLIKFKGAGYCRWLQTRVKITNDYQLSIYSITWQNETKEQVKKSMPV